MAESNGNGNGLLSKAGIYPLIISALIGAAGGGGGSLALQKDSYLEDRKFIADKLQTLTQQQQRMLTDQALLKDAIAQLQIELARSRSARRHEDRRGSDGVTR